MGSEGGTARDSSSTVGQKERLGIIPVLLACVLLLASLVLMHMLGTDGKHLIRSLVCIAPAAAISLIGILILTRTYWDLVRGRYNSTEVILIAVFLAFPVMVMTLETFAGITTLLWDRGLLFSTSELNPSLWTVEKLYAWHIADTVPVLEVTKTLGWKAPVTFTDNWSGALLLMFKVVLLVPLLGILTVSYQVFRDHNMGELKVPEAEGQDLTAVPRYLMWWLRYMISPIFAYVVIFFLVSSSSPLNHWLVSTLRISWAPIIVRVLGVAFVLVLTVRAVFFALRHPKMDVPSMGGDVLFSVSSVMPRIRELIMTTLTACTITILLLPSGVTRTVPILQPGDEVPATVEWYSWHLLDTIPFVEAPQSLNWSLKFEFVDPLSRALLLVLKIELALLLFLPIIFLFELYKRMGAETRGEPTGSGVAPDQHK